MRLIGLVIAAARHATIVLALVFLAFSVLDWFNPLMGFASSPAAAPLLVTFCLSALVTASLQGSRQGGRR